MDRLPSGPIQTTEALTRRQKLQERAILEIMVQGGDMRAVVEELASGDETKAKRWRMRFRQWAQEPSFIEMVGRYVSGELVLSLMPASAALGRRAAKGNVPAIKLAMEAAGFYSPKSQVEHSGDITLSINNAPRPETVVDAEVVEED